MVDSPEPAADEVIAAFDHRALALSMFREKTKSNEDQLKADLALVIRTANRTLSAHVRNHLHLIAFFRTHFSGLLGHHVDEFLPNSVPTSKDIDALIRSMLQADKDNHTIPLDLFMRAGLTRDMLEVRQGFDDQLAFVAYPAQGDPEWVPPFGSIEDCIHGERRSRPAENDALDPDTSQVRPLGIWMSLTPEGFS